MVATSLKIKDSNVFSLARRDSKIWILSNFSIIFSIMSPDEEDVFSQNAALPSLPPLASCTFGV